jgi:thioredoxin type arsenate reductase
MQGTVQKLKVLFLCTGNSCRSQMAEGWARHLKGDVMDPYSAGIKPRGLDPRAIQVMAEADVDISGHRAKGIDELKSIRFDYVVTVCDQAHESCPLFPGRTKVIHVGFDDPPKLAEDSATEEETLNHYRRVRDEIKTFIENDLGKGLRMIDDPSPDQQEQIREAVREGYGKIATTGGTCGSSCCGSGAADQVARVVGYSEAELATLPDGANMGLSCGNPTALASLQAGEVVLDLGSGGGFDVFIAGQKVGPTGRVIGVDMTPDMVSKARHGTAAYHRQTGLDNVEFRLGEIEHLPVADASVDVVISNCVLNLSPDKPQVWREIGRVLKPGGRVAISDLALLQPLPEEIRNMVESLIGCLAGAVLVDETRAMAEAAGLVDIQLTPKPGYVDAMMDWNDPLYRKIIEHLPAGTKAGDYVTSLAVAAKKGEGSASGAGEKRQHVYTPAVGELVALGAAIAANCEPCFKYHYAQARHYGVSNEDMACAVTMAQKVKQAPARAVLNLANRYLGCSASAEEAGAPPAGTCCGTPAVADGRASAVPGDSTRRAGKTNPGGKSCCS